MMTNADYQRYFITCYLRKQQEPHNRVRLLQGKPKHTAKNSLYGIMCILFPYNEHKQAGYFCLIHIYWMHLFLCLLGMHRAIYWCLRIHKRCYLLLPNITMQHFLNYSEASSSLRLLFTLPVSPVR